MIQWESPNELNAFRILDANPAVKQFFEQPAEIHYVLNGELHRHYPDALVFIEDCKEFWEVKPQRDALEPETVARTALLAEALPLMGFQYRMVIGEDLACEPRLSNVSTILQFGRCDVSLVDRERLRRQLEDNQTIVWGDVLDGVLGTNGRNQICRLVLEGTIGFDFKQPLCRNTLLQRACAKRDGKAEEV